MIGREEPLRVSAPLILDKVTAQQRATGTWVGHPSSSSQSGLPQAHPVQVSVTRTSIAVHFLFLGKWSFFTSISFFFFFEKSFILGRDLGLGYYLNYKHFTWGRRQPHMVSWFWASIKGHTGFTLSPQTHECRDQSGRDYSWEEREALLGQRANSVTAAVLQPSPGFPDSHSCLWLAEWELTSHPPPALVK